MTTEIQELKNRVVAIVKFGIAGFESDGMKSGEYYQVTLDPKHVSPSGEYIRLGLHQGDEILGWQRCKALSIVEILGEWEESEELPILHYGQKLPSFNFLIKQ